MAEPTTTSGATPADAPVTPPAQAATKNTSEPQAGDDQDFLTGQISLEEARKLRSEASNLRKREKEALAQLKVYQEAEEAAKAAQMSELEKAQKQTTDLQEQQEALAAELFEARVRQNVADLISKFNFIPSARTIATLLLADDDAIEFEDGRPSNIEKLLEKLAKAEPDLVKPQAATSGTPGTPQLPAMNPGRTSIQSPGATIPGRIPRLEDIPWKR